MSDNLCISLPITGHPLLEADGAARTEYVGVLRTVAKRFSADKRWTEDTVKAFARGFNIGLVAAVAPDDLRVSVRRLTADRFSFRKFRFNPAFP
jgi:hypothetical protein